MDVRTKGIVSALVTVAAWGACLPAAAQTYTVTYTGTVSGTDTNDLFGGGGLYGDAFSLTFTYDVTNGYRYTGTGYDEIGGGSAYNLVSPILTDSLTINGISLSLGTSYEGQVFVYNPIYEGFGFSQAFVEDSSGNLLTGEFGDPSWNAIANLTAPQSDTVAHSLYWGLLRYDGEFVSLYNTTVSISDDIPEPSSLALLATATGMIALVARRRRA